MTSTAIYYYQSSDLNCPFTKFLDSLNPKQQTKILRIILQIEKYGLTSAIPHLKKLKGTPFWEIRILGQDNFRIIYAVIYKNSLLILHAFNKKSQKTPPKEIFIALNRFKDWQSRS